MLDERLSAISVSYIAEQANLTVESVTNLLAGIRDEVVEVVKNQTVALNFGFGTLTLRVGGSVEFKSVRDSEPIEVPGEVRSMTLVPEND